MSSGVIVAFERLIETILAEKERLAEAVKEATLSGQFTDAQRLLARTERIERLLQEVRRLRDAWEQFEKTESSSVARSDADVVPVQTEPCGAKDSPELNLVDQLFGKPRRKSFGGPKGINKTPQSAYRIPILEALVQLGGRARSSEVLRVVYEKMKDRLTEDDLKRTPSGADLRWANTAQWERYLMVREGLLKRDSPRGVWEITEAGRAYLEQARQEEENKP